MIDIQQDDGNRQRVGVLSLLPGLVRRLGVDPAELLQAVDLGPTALSDPEATILYATMGRLLHLAAAWTGCPHLGVELGSYIRPASLGLVGELMRNAATLGEALTDFAAHQHRNSHGSVVYLLTDKHQAYLGYAIYQADVAGNDLICDGAASAAVNIVADLLGSDCTCISEVLLSRAEPVDATFWQRSLGVKLCFNADQTAVVFPRPLLDRPVTGADPRLRAELKERLEMLSDTGEFDLVTQLRRTVRVRLLAGKVSAAGIAQELGMTEKTMSRRLTAAGLKFQDVLDATRCEFARQLLRNTRLRVGEIGGIVGFSGPGVFTRAFTRWLGVRPGEWRAGV